MASETRPDNARRARQAAHERRELELQCCDMDVFATAITTLLTYARNAEEHPGDTKYRTVNMKNRNFTSRIGRFPAGMKLMQLMGFDVDATEERLVLSTPLCTAVADAIRGTCDTPAPAAVAADAAPPPSEHGDQDGMDAAADDATFSGDVVQHVESVAELLTAAAGTAAVSDDVHPGTGLLPPRSTTESRLSPVPPLPSTQVPAQTQSASAVTSPAAIPQNSAVWACRRCTFHNTNVHAVRCEVCRSDRHAPSASVACSPIAVPDEAASIRATADRCVATSPQLPPPTTDVGVGSSPAQTTTTACGGDGWHVTDAACSPMPATTTADVGCSANIRTLKTPNVSAGAGAASSGFAVDAQRRVSASHVAQQGLPEAHRVQTASLRSESAPIHAGLRLAGGSQVVATAHNGPHRLASATVGAAPPAWPQPSRRYPEPAAPQMPGAPSRMPSSSLGSRHEAASESVCAGVMPTQTAPLQDVTNQAQPRAGSKAARAGSGTPLRRELVSALECGVCLCLMVYPVTAPCGHSYCRHCLGEAVAKAGRKCPSCRAACDIDVLSAPENKLIANMAKVANPAEYRQRCGEADAMLVRLQRQARYPSLPVLIGDDCPCPGSVCKLQLAEARDIALLRFIARNGGSFILLPSAEGGRVRVGSVGLQCTLRRAENLPNGQASASVVVGQRVLVREHDIAAEGHTTAEHTPHTDTNDATFDALAAAYNLKKMIGDFFATQFSGIQRQVERFAGPEPSLPVLPRTRSAAPVPLAASRYTFWVAAVLSHLRVLSKRLKPSLIIQRDCLSRATTLSHIIVSVLHAQPQRAAGGQEGVSQRPARQRPAGLTA